MPRFVIWHVIFDDRNRHATRRATEAQIGSILSGIVRAAPNKRSGTAANIVTGTAFDGTRWTIAFNYDPAEQSARPITAFPA